VVLFHIQNGISHGSESLSPTVVTESDKRYKHGGNEHLIIKKKMGAYVSVSYIVRVKHSFKWLYRCFLDLAKKIAIAALGLRLITQLTRI
jgi:hypothetical protein